MLAGRAVALERPQPQDFVLRARPLAEFLLAARHPLGDGVRAAARMVESSRWSTHEESGLHSPSDDDVPRGWSEVACRFGIDSSLLRSHSRRAATSPKGTARGAGHRDTSGGTTQSVSRQVWLRTCSSAGAIGSRASAIAGQPWTPPGVRAGSEVGRAVARPILGIGVPARTPASGSGCSASPVLSLHLDHLRLLRHPDKS